MAESAELASAREGGGRGRRMTDTVPSCCFSCLSGCQDAPCFSLVYGSGTGASFVLIKARLVSALQEVSVSRDLNRQ